MLVPQEGRIFRRFRHVFPSEKNGGFYRAEFEPQESVNVLMEASPGAVGDGDVEDVAVVFIVFLTFKKENLPGSSKGIGGGCFWFVFFKSFPSDEGFWGESSAMKKLLMFSEG